MKSVEEYATRYRETVQAAVTDEEVEAVGVLCRPNGLISVLAPFGPIIRLIGRKRSGGLPMNVVVAVTPTRVLFFAFKPRLSSIKLKGLVRTLDRRQVTVSLGTGSLARRVTFHTADGTSFELDSNRSIGQYDRMNDGLMQALGVLPTAA